jgi:DGQHR domain-containing protein
MGKQKGQRIFAGILPAEDLLALTTIDHYNSKLPLDDPRQGYQRPPERSRITKIGSYLIKNIVNDDGDVGSSLFPTAVTLAARKPLDFNESTRELRLSVDEKLQIVDGQHRIEGLRYAIEEKGADYLRDFPIPFVIMEMPSRVAEMNQFRIINSSAKAVRTDLVNTILAAKVAREGDTSVSENESWKVVVTRVVDRLDKEVSSPWHGLILMPDESGSPKGNGKKVVRATSFMTSLKAVYQPLEYYDYFDDVSTLNDKADIMFEVVAPYWAALKSLVPEAFEEPRSYVIQKTPGLFSLHELLARKIIPWFTRQNLEWEKGNFQKILSTSREITDPMFWHKDENRASAYGSMKGFKELYELLSDSLDKSIV